MPTLSQYYGRAKSFADINPRDMQQLGEDWLVTAAAGAGVGLISASIDGLDKQIAGFTVPVDGLISIGLGYAGLSMGGDTGKALKIASIAIGGSAAVRTFEKFFAKGLGLKGGAKVKGEFEDIGYGQLPGYGGQWGPAVAFGQAAQDRLVEAAKYL